MSWKLWGLNITDGMALFCISLMQSRNSVLSCWWVGGWETPLPHKINQTKIGVSILTAAEAGEAGQGATSALSWKVHAAEPLAHSLSAVPRGKEPNLGLLDSSSFRSPVSSLPVISVISLCDLGQHISSQFCTKKQTRLRVARGRQSPRDPRNIGATSWHKEVCEGCGIGYCWSVFSEESLNISTFPGSQNSRPSFCSALVKQSEVKCLKGVFTEAWR